MQGTSIKPGALGGIKVFDLTRILAGPTCTQLLGDLGADIFKIERPIEGDDTRKWGPPYLEGPDGEPTSESAYFLCANRNKRSVAIDIALPQGKALARRLIAKCDVLVENFKVGGLAKFGLDYPTLAREFPGLVYCSVTGFGQTGPYASRAGYDFLAQGAGGIMSITGEPGGEPMKVGAGVADLMCGMYAAVAIVSALRHRDHTGEGQHIDMALLDTQVAWLVNEAENYLVSGQVPRRLGNEHPNIVPYKAFPSSDGWVILAIGNDGQFRKWCEFAGCPDLALDPRFRTNPDRLRDREALYAIMPDYTRRKTTGEWETGLASLGVPCGPVNSIDQVFEDPHIRARGMRIEMDHPLSGDSRVPLVASPVKMSATPPSYRYPPPYLGQHTDEVLGELLGLSSDDIASLRQSGVIG